MEHGGISNDKFVLSLILTPSNHTCRNGGTIVLQFMAFNEHST